MPTPENIKLSYLSSVEIPKGSSAPSKDKSIEITELSGMVYLPKVDRNGLDTGSGVMRAIGDKTKTAQKNPIDGAKADEPQSAVFDFDLKLKDGKLQMPESKIEVHHSGEFS